MDNVLRRRASGLVYARPLAAVILLPLVAFAWSPSFDLSAVFVGSLLAGLFLVLPTYWLLWIAVATGTLTVYRWDVVGLGQLSLYRAFLLIALASLLIDRAWGRKLKIDPIGVLLVGMCIWDLIGAQYSPRPALGSRIAFQEVEYPLTWLLVINAVESQRQVAGMLRAFMLSVLLGLVLTGWQWLAVFVWKVPFQWPLWELTRLPERARWLGWVGARDAALPYDRVSSVLGDSINFANVAAVGLCLALAWLATRKRLVPSPVLRWSFLATLVMAPLLTLASGSRGGPVALVAGMLFVPSELRRRFLNPKLVGGFVTAVVLVLVVPGVMGYNKSLIGMYVGRVQDDWRRIHTSEGAMGGRLTAQTDAIGVWGDNPLLGVGEAGLPDGTHSQLADNLAENGLWGGVLVVGFYLFWYEFGVRRLRRNAEDRRTRPELALLGTAAVPLFVIWLVFSFTYGYWYQPFYVFIPALMVAAAAALDGLPHAAVSPEPCAGPRAPIHPMSASEPA